MTKRIILTCLALIWAANWIGCADMLNQQKAKDRDLAAVMNENLKTSMELSSHFKSFDLLSEGRYKVVCKDLTDAQQAGNYAYNIAVRLYDRNVNKVKTGRSMLITEGYQDGVKIFEVTYGTGMVIPQVVFFGPYEGTTYTPSR
ncbi:MAG: hypothetical protein ABIC40_03580 [bacterium]